MPSWVGVAINVHEVRRREEMRRSLRLFIHHIVVPISHQRTVVCVEELLLWRLGGGGGREGGREGEEDREREVRDEVVLSRYLTLFLPHLLIRFAGAQPKQSEVATAVSRGTLRTIWREPAVEYAWHSLTLVLGREGGREGGREEGRGREEGGGRREGGRGEGRGMPPL